MMSKNLKMTIKPLQMHWILTLTTTSILAMTKTTTHHPFCTTVHPLHLSPLFPLHQPQTTQLHHQYPSMTFGLSLTLFPLINA